MTLINLEDTSISRNSVLWAIEHWHDLIPTYEGNTKDYMEHLHNKIFSLPTQQSNELNHPTIISWWFQPDGWIDVRDMLPEQEWRYLIYPDDKYWTIRIWEYIESEKCFWYLWTKIYTSHWQPIPLPPK